MTAAESEMDNIKGMKKVKLIIFCTFEIAYHFSS